MRPTVEYLQKQFTFLNNQCFEGKLKPVPIVLSNASTFLGRLCFVRKRVLGRVRLSDFIIRISVRYDMEESVIIDTLLHEMIHYYIASFNIKDTSSHGEVFQKIMNALNARFGYHLSVTHKVVDGTAMAEQKTKEREMKRTAYKRHFIGVAQLHDGNTYVLQAASTRVRMLDRLLRQYYPIKSLQWYGSISPFWNKYPNCITPKLYAIDKADLEKELLNMILLNEE